MELSRRTCIYCNKMFPRTSSKNRHEREVHLRTLEDLILDKDRPRSTKSKKRVPTASVADSPELRCNHCDKCYSTVQNRKRHEESIHGISSGSMLNTSVVCFKCTSRFPSLSKYREHLEQAHQIVTTQMEYDFLSEKEFLEWKEKLEMDVGVTYTLHSGAKKTLHGTKQTYFCQRSGVKRMAAQESSKETQQGTKSQGNSKIRQFCTSSIDVLRNDGRVQVTYFVDHHDHDLDMLTLAHTKLSKCEDKIAGHRTVVLPHPSSGVRLYAVQDVNSSPPGKQIMKVEKFVQEVRELYTAKSKQVRFRFGEAMSPRVIIRRLSPRIIEQYTRRYRRRTRSGSLSEVDEFSESSYGLSEDEMETAVSQTPDLQTPSQFCRLSEGQVQEKSQGELNKGYVTIPYEGLALSASVGKDAVQSDDQDEGDDASDVMDSDYSSDLPDLTDPSWESPSKKVGRKKSPNKKLRKKKHKRIDDNFRKRKDPKLMKSAKKAFEHHRKIFGSPNKYDKRLEDLKDSNSSKHPSQRPEVSEPEQSGAQPGAWVQQLPNQFPNQVTGVNQEMAVPPKNASVIHDESVTSMASDSSTNSNKENLRQLLNANMYETLMNPFRLSSEKYSVAQCQRQAISADKQSSKEKMLVIEDSSQSEGKRITSLNNPVALPSSDSAITVDISEVGQELVTYDSDETVNFEAPEETHGNLVTSSNDVFVNCNTSVKRISQDKSVIDGPVNCDNRKRQRSESVDENGMEKRKRIKEEETEKPKGVNVHLPMVVIPSTRIVTPVSISSLTNVTTATTDPIPFQDQSGGSLEVAERVSDIHIVRGAKEKEISSCTSTGKRVTMEGPALMLQSQFLPQMTMLEKSKKDKRLPSAPPSEGELSATDEKIMKSESTEMGSSDKPINSVKELFSLIMELSYKRTQCEEKISKIKEDSNKRIEMVEAEKKEYEKEMEKLVSVMQNWKESSPEKSEANANQESAHNAAAQGLLAAGTSQRSTADLPQRSTADLPQRSTADLSQRSTADLAQRSTADLAQRSTADLAQRSTADLAQRSTADLAQKTSLESKSQASTSSVHQDPLELQTSQGSISNLASPDTGLQGVQVFTKLKQVSHGASSQKISKCTSVKTITVTDVGASTTEKISTTQKQKKLTINVISAANINRFGKASTSPTKRRYKKSPSKRKAGTSPTSQAVSVSSTPSDQHSEELSQTPRGSSDGTTVVASPGSVMLPQTQSTTQAQSGTSLIWPQGTVSGPQICPNVVVTNFMQNVQQQPTRLQLIQPMLPPQYPPPPYPEHLRTMKAVVPSPGQQFKVVQQGTPDGMQTVSSMQLGAQVNQIQAKAPKPDQQFQIVSLQQSQQQIPQLAMQQPTTSHQLTQSSQSLKLQQLLQHQQQRTTKQGSKGNKTGHQSHLLVSATPAPTLGGAVARPAQPSQPSSSSASRSLCVSKSSSQPSTQSSLQLTQPVTAPVNVPQVAVVEIPGLPAAASLNATQESPIDFSGGSRNKIVGGTSNTAILSQVQDWSRHEPECSNKIEGST